MDFKEKRHYTLLPPRFGTKLETEVSPSSSFISMKPQRALGFTTITAGEKQLHLLTMGGTKLLSGVT